LVLSGNEPEDGTLGGFLQFASDENFVEDVVCLVEVENKIEFANVSEEPV
jgi:hypothetical protein